MKNFALLLIFFMSSQVLASQQAKIEFKGSPQVSMGDTVVAEFTFWPKNDVTPADIKALESSFLGKQKIFIGSVSQVRESENNELALVARFVLVPVAQGDTSDIEMIKIKGVDYPLRMSTLKIARVEKVSEKFLSLDQGFAQSSHKYYYGIPIAVALILVMAFLFFRARKKSVLTPEDLGKHWRLKLRKAKGRKDYEELYRARSQWLGKVLIADREVMAFLELLYQHQYKKEWEGSVREEIDHSFSKLREKVND